MEYEEQLRRLLLYNIVIFILIFVLSSMFSSAILKIFGHGFKELYVFGIGDALNTLLHIGFSIALVLYLPIGLFSFSKFFEDALYPNEKKTIKKYTVITVLLAILGIIIGVEISKFTIVFGKWITNLLGVKFIQSAKEIFMINFTITIGTAFCLELFPILRLAIKFGIVEKETIIKYRPIIYIVMYILVAILTPGDYLIGDISLFALLVVLFELTVRL